MNGESPTDDAGFTLVELIVALALLALMFSALAAATSISTRATAHAEISSEQMAIYAANRFMRDAIAGALPLHIRRPGSANSELQFEGTRTSLRFAANLPGRTTVAGVHIIEFALRNGDKGGSTLAVSLGVYRPSQHGAQELAKERDILRSVKTLSFSYYGVKTRGEPPRWYDTWSKSSQLPQLVALDMSFEDPKRWTWPATRALIIRSQYQ